MSEYAFQLCDYRTEPRPGSECYVANWSQGRSCKACDHKCHRAGMTAAQATADNARLVRERLAKLEAADQ